MATTREEIEVNGLNIPIIFEQDKRLPIATLQFVFQNSGSATSDEKAGLVKFSAKVLNEGTKKLGSSKFADELESRAIHISASAGQETFVLEMSLLAQELENGVNYFDALLKDPNLTKDVVEKVRTVTLGSLANKENDFDYIASHELKSLLYDGTQIAKPSLGTPKSVSEIELLDVEEFLKNTLVSSKLIVVAGGDIELEDIKKRVKKIIETMPIGELKELQKFPVTKEVKEKIIKKDTKQAYIYFGSPYNMDVNSPDNYKAKVAMFILGAGGFGSRLMEEIRVKKGLAYSAYAKVDTTKTSSNMNGYLQTKLESMDDAKATVREVISKFVENGVTKDELEHTKKFLLGSEPLRVETMNQRLSRTFMEFYNGKELGESSKELKKIEELKLDELNKFIKSHREILELSFAIVTK